MSLLCLKPLCDTMREIPSITIYNISMTVVVVAFFVCLFFVLFCLDDIVIMVREKLM